MTVTLSFYQDAALTVPLAQFARSAAADGSTGAVDAVIYVGSPAAGKTFRAASNPGVDPILLSIDDTAAGSGHPASEIKLALSSGGLAGAVGGAALNLGVQISSGAGGAMPVYMRWTNTVAATGLSTELALQMTTVVEN